MNLFSNLFQNVRSQLFHECGITKIISSLLCIDILNIDHFDLQLGILNTSIWCSSLAIRDLNDSTIWCLSRWKWTDLNWLLSKGVEPQSLKNTDAASKLVHCLDQHSEVYTSGTCDLMITSFWSCSKLKMNFIKCKEEHHKCCLIKSKWNAIFSDLKIFNNLPWPDNGCISNAGLLNESGDDVRLIEWL